MYLLDTNIWLENILEQEKHDEVKKFLTTIDDNKLYISRFSFYSIGLHLFFKNKKEAFLSFVNDLFLEGSVNLISLNPHDMNELIINSRKYNLTFDDSYQYTCAKKNNLILVSFDVDFDKSDIKRLTPIRILHSKELK